MTACYPAGALRAYLDDELPGDDAIGVETHLATCATCQSQIGELRALHEQTSRVLAAVTTSGVSLETAWSRVQAQLSAAQTGHSTTPQPPKVTILSSRRRRPALVAAAVAALMVAALLVPSVRAAADQLLQIFRAQSVIYVSVSPTRVQQIEQLKGDQNALFLSQPTLVGTPSQVQQVSSLKDAQTLVGFAPQAPTVLPGQLQSSSVEVRGQSTYQLQVNVQTVRQILSALGVTDVQVPDALGAQPITIALPPLVHVQYVGSNYRMSLIEGTSPSVNLPAGVDLSQLGKAALEVYGMSPQQADTMSKHIDWASTLVFPFPTNMSQLQQVDINGATGILLDAQGNSSLGGLRHSSSQQAGQSPTTSGTPANSGAGQSPTTSGAPANSQSEVAVYWQRGNHFYILTGQGLGDGALIAAASSLH